MSLNMGNITDDQTEQLLRFVRTVANFMVYGKEMEPDAEDAITSLNLLIGKAREIMSQKGGD